MSASGHNLQHNQQHSSHSDTDYVASGQNSQSSMYQSHRKSEYSSSRKVTASAAIY